MPRISQEDIAKREEFLYGLFKEIPDLSAPKANERIKEKFGSSMRPPRIYEIRDLVARKEPLSSSTEKNGKSSVAARAPRGKKGARSAAAIVDSHSKGKQALAHKPIPIASSEEEREALERVRQILTSVGWEDVRISYTPRRERREIVLNPSRATQESAYLPLDQAG